MGLRASEIRELLKWTQRPDIISFAGGLPSPESFPVEDVKKICQDVLENEPEKALQYGTTEGVIQLREALADRMKKKGVDCDADQFIITHGAQQGIDLICKVFLDSSDMVITSQPTYLGFRTALIAFQVPSQGVPLSNDGMRIDCLEDKLKSLKERGMRPKLIYTMPTFHNPVGVTMPESNRKELLELASEYDLLVIEDDPYGELRYEGEDLKPMVGLDDEGRVIYLSTFSKILAPGFRLAWIIAPEKIRRRLVLAKQASDLCTNSFGQYVAYHYLDRGLMDEMIARTRALYMKKRETMLQAMREHFPEGSTWTEPQGGLFLWATMPKGIDTHNSLMKSLENKVAYVPGTAFHTEGGARESMRLNFSFPTIEQIKEGIRRLGEVMSKEARSVEVPASP